jgi:hypothetical protein
MPGLAFSGSDCAHIPQHKTFDRKVLHYDATTKSSQRFDSGGDMGFVRVRLGEKRRHNKVPAVQGSDERGAEDRPCPNRPRFDCL